MAAKSPNCQPAVCVAADQLRQRGFAVCKPDRKEKKPTYKEWGTRSLEPSDYREGDQLGILGGPLSDGGKEAHALVIVDLDSPEAVKHAGEYLPLTGMSEGRASKPRSHRYYLVSFASIPEWAESRADQAATGAKRNKGHPGPFLKHFEHRESKKGVLDFIGTGGQVVCPPSLHASGELRQWTGKNPSCPDEPAVVPFLQLWQAVCELASCCGAAIPSTGNSPPRGRGEHIKADVAERAAKYLQKCEPSVSGQGGHKRLFYAARAMVYGFDLGTEQAYHLLASEFNPRCSPQWSEAELRHKIEDADRTPFDKPRGWLRDEKAERNGKHSGGGTGARTKPTKSTSRPTWPILHPDAMIGPAAALVNAIEPHTEADPVGILFQLLVGFGSIIGRKPYFQVEENRHYGNEYLLLIGDTAQGRKGTAWGHALRALSIADSQWANERLKGGLSSAEGLIDLIRDEVKGEGGVEDKRLLVQEDEFANVLKQSERKGNTLSETLRQAWDSRPLGNLVRHSPARCKEPHVSIIGHITPDDLHQHLTACDANNGLANRFLFVCVRRSKELPEGGKPNRDLLNNWAQEIAKSAEGTKLLDVVPRTDAARGQWREHYSRLTSARPGIVGSLSARCAPHVCRLSMLYALLDGKNEIDERHLKAAIAAWDYSEASLRYIFGDALSNPTADEILAALREVSAGLTRTDIRNLFGRNKKASEINRALAVLENLKLAKCQTSETGGRPAERWLIVE